VSLFGNSRGQVSMLGRIRGVIVGGSRGQVSKLGGSRRKGWFRWQGGSRRHVSRFMT